MDDLDCVPLIRVPRIQDLGAYPILLNGLFPASSPIAVPGAPRLPCVMK